MPHGSGGNAFFTHLDPGGADAKYAYGVKGITEKKEKDHCIGLWMLHLYSLMRQRKYCGDQRDEFMRFSPSG